jgi:cell wall-associated NlpC family hydrolase
MERLYYKSRLLLLGLGILIAWMLPAAVPAFAQNTPPTGGAPAFAEDADDSGMDWVRVISDSAELFKAPSLRSDVVRTPKLYDIFMVVDRVKSFYLVRDEETQSFLFIDQYAVEFTEYDPPKSSTNYIRNEKMVLGTTSPDDQLFGSYHPRRSSSKEGQNDGYCAGKWYPTSYDSNYGYAPRLDPSELVQDAESYMGTRYVSGGNGHGGIDCSGLVSACARQQDVSLPRRASLQAEVGRMVSRSELQTGDIIYFRDTRDSGYLSHTGIYLGGGRFIHASSHLGHVGISSLSEDYYSRHFAFGRRM